MTPITVAGTGPVIIACGALARELRAVLERAQLTEIIDVRYLPAHLHNRPDQIEPTVGAELAEIGDHRPVFVAYADCGTGGGLDRLLAGHPGVQRLPGAHCYELFAGAELFAALHDAEPGTFYLTDYLALHFDALVWRGLGLDAHPELRDILFAHYRRIVLLSQTSSSLILRAAEAAADRLGLPLLHHHVGRGRLADAVTLSIRRHEVA